MHVNIMRLDGAEWRIIVRVANYTKWAGIVEGLTSRELRDHVDEKWPGAEIWTVEKLEGFEDIWETQFHRERTLRQEGLIARLQALQQEIEEALKELKDLG